MVLIAVHMNEGLILLIWYFTIYSGEHVAEKIATLFMMNYPTPAC